MVGRINRWATRALESSGLNSSYRWLDFGGALQLLGKAIGYTLGQWPKLIRYLDHPAIGPDTNACENAIRPFVLGRKNWLFSGSPRGAAASAGLFSLIETAKANGLEPYWYLRKLFEQLPAARTDAEIERLAPIRPVSR